MQSTLRRFYLPDDNIHVFTVQDSSLATVHQWQREATFALEHIAGKAKHLYDLRALRSLSVYALQAAIKLKAHPQADNVYVAVLATESRVVELVDLVLRIQPGGHFRIFAQEGAAVAWLNVQVPDSDEISQFFSRAYLVRQANR